MGSEEENYPDVTEVYDGAKVLFENERVRVIDIEAAPGKSVPMHSHKTFRVGYSLTDSKARFSMPDGSSRDLPIEEGEVFWTEPTTHASENIGDTDLRTIFVELK